MTTLSSVRAPADEVRQVTVVVPARNEQALIGRCLHSLTVASEQLRLRRPDVAVELVVVLDACTDDTAHVVAGHPAVTVVSVDAARVGAARQAGIRLLVEREEREERRGHGGDTSVGDGRAGHWVANTDADSTVPPSWLLDQLALAEDGHDVVVGVVEPDPAELSCEVRARWSGLHRLVEGHDHVHGANLSFRLSSYLDAGGFDALAVHEDVRLVERLRARGARVTSTAQVRVRTSARTTGRAPSGFAAYLEDLVTHGATPRAERPDRLKGRSHRTA